MAGPVGLDMLAVLRIAESIDIEETPALMERLRVLETHTLAKIREREEAGHDGK